MAILFFRHAEAGLQKLRSDAYTRLYVAIALDNAAAVSRESRAVQEADVALAALNERRRALLEAAQAAAANESYDSPRSIFDIALDKN